MYPFAKILFFPIRDFVARPSAVENRAFISVRSGTFSFFRICSMPCRYAVIFPKRSMYLVFPAKNEGKPELLRQRRQPVKDGHVPRRSCRKYVRCLIYPTDRYSLGRSLGFDHRRKICLHRQGSYHSAAWRKLWKGRGDRPACTRVFSKKVKTCIHRKGTNPRHLVG